MLKITDAKIEEQTWNRMIKCTPHTFWVLQKVCCLSRIGKKKARKYNYCESNLYGCNWKMG